MFANANVEVALPILELAAVALVLLLLTTTFGGSSQRRTKNPDEPGD